MVNSKNKTQLFYIVIFVCHLVLITILYYKFGVNTQNEGDKYLTRANYFANGEFINATQYQTFYIAYVAYLALLTYIKLPTFVYFICTYLLSLIAYYKFHNLLQQLTNKLTAQIWLSCMLLSPMIQYWHLNLFSESFFIIVSLLFSYVALYSKVKLRVLKVFFLAFVVILSRPSGIFTVICVLSCKIYKDKLLPKNQIVLLLLGVLFSLFYLILTHFQLPYHDFAEYISNGSIYYGFKQWPEQLPPGDYTLLDCYQFIIEKKGIKTFILQFFKKFDSFFVAERPYYSTFHNVINIAHYIFYPLALVGLYQLFKKNKYQFVMILGFVGIIILNALMITLIFNEWSERHLIHVFPFIFILSSFMLAEITTRFVKNKNTINNPI